MSTLDTAAIPDNMILSNRDKAQHSDQRGLDSKMVQTMQYRDHAANRRPEEDGSPDARPIDGDEDEQ